MVGLDKKLGTGHRTGEWLWSEYVAVGNRDTIANIAGEIAVGHKETMNPEVTWTECK